MGFAPLARACCQACGETNGDMKNLPLTCGRCTSRYNVTIWGAHTPWVNVPGLCKQARGQLVYSRPPRRQGTSPRQPQRSASRAGPARDRTQAGLRSLTASRLDDLCLFSPYSGWREKPFVAPREEGCECARNWLYNSTVSYRCQALWMSV